MMNRFSFAIVGLVLLAVLSNTGTISWATNQLLAPLAPGNDDMPYARRMADTIQDTPACARFRQAILEAGKGPPAAASTKVTIINAYEEAKKYGCRKPQP
jgi:hypothetical protein